MKMMRRMPQVAAAILAGLVLAGPVHAAGRSAPFAPSTAFERAWQWWESLWSETTHTAGPAAHSSPRPEKSGTGPASSPAGSDTVTSCQVNCDKGPGIDPDG